MGTKISAKQLALRVGKEIRCRRLFFFIPLISSIFIGLLGNISFQSTNDVMNIVLTYKRISLLIIVSMAVCWEAIYTKKYVEDSSAEIFFLYDRNYRYMTAICMYPLYILMLVPYLIVSKIFCPDFDLFAIWLIITLLFICSLTCTLSFITNNITTTVMTLIVYIFACFILPDKFNMFPFFFNSLGYDFAGEFTKVYLPMILVSAIVLILGSKISRYKIGNNI